MDAKHSARCSVELKGNQALCGEMWGYVDGVVEIWKCRYNVKCLVILVFPYVLYTKYPVHELHW